MKGLIRKDLYMIWRYGRMLLLMSAVFILLPSLQSQNAGSGVAAGSLGCVGCGASVGA